MNAKEILSSAIKYAKEQITQITAELDAPVLDGTPWMICMHDESGCRVMGEWPSLPDGVTTKGFLHISAVPGHACGAYMLSEVRAKDWVINNGKKFSMMHVREFKQERVSELQALIASLETL